jgi:hypothetical protein
LINKYNSINFLIYLHANLPGLKTITNLAGVRKTKEQNNYKSNKTQCSLQNNNNKKKNSIFNNETAQRPIIIK